MHPEPVIETPAHAVTRLNDTIIQKMGPLWQCGVSGLRQRVMSMRW
jgi:hypothetical protein